MPASVLTGPRWARAAATTVLGDGWPAGDETATWDVADQWYALADALAGPRMSAFAAAGQIVAGLVGAGIAPDGFREAWEGLSGDDDAPLNALVQIAAELGQMVEECGREIQAAKLAAWIEIGTLLTELTELSVAVELTSGAAVAPAEAMIAASRVAVERIYAGLASALEGARPARPSTAGPAHSAPSEQRTVRLTVPRRAGSAAAEAPAAKRVAAGIAAFPEPPEPAAGESRKAGAVGARTRRNTGEKASLVGKRSTGSAEETRRVGPADGLATRRLAPRRLTGEQTRRLESPRPAYGRPTIPLQRTAESEGHAFDRVRRDEYADFLAGLAHAIRSNLAVAGENRALAAYADEVEAEAARVRAQISSAPARPAPRTDPAGDARLPDPRPGTGREGRPADDTRLPDSRAGTGREGRPADDTRLPDSRAGTGRFQWPAGAGAVPDGSGPDGGRGLGRPGPGGGEVPGWARERRELGGPAEEQTPGGLRRPHAVHLKALHDAVPAADRLPDPRLGRWFSLLNAGGPADDPTRGVNCLDAVLALFETYQRGRPRVAGARTFDSYAHGAPERPVGGEWAGVRRIQQAARAEFQNLCPFVGGAPAEQARAAVDAAFRNLANHLHNSGHGAFAFVLTDFPSGGCHAWAAVNQAGTILFLDPQLGSLSAGEPLYRDVVSMDALVVDGRGEPAPLPYHGTGQWTSI